MMIDMILLYLLDYSSLGIELTLNSNNMVILILEQFSFKSNLNLYRMYDCRSWTIFGSTKLNDVL